MIYRVIGKTLTETGETKYVDVLYCGGSLEAAATAYHLHKPIESKTRVYYVERADVHEAIEDMEWAR